MPTSKAKLRSYLKSQTNLFEMLPYIPQKYITLKRRDFIENLYLIDSKIAKDAVSQVVSTIQKNNKQVVCETNAGLGLISSELLDAGVPVVRLCESCPDFRVALKVCNNCIVYFFFY